MKKRKIDISQLILIVVLSLICIVWFFPLFYIILTSFRTDESIMYEGFSFFPTEWTFNTYKAVLGDQTRAPIIRWFFNSLITSSITAVLVVLISSMSAYGFSRLHFKGKKGLFTFLMFTMMIPSVITLIPNFTIISFMGLKNTIWALIIPSLGGVSNIFLIRQFLYSVPKELDEAAAIDGASKIRTFFQIILPQIVPVLITVGLFTFLGSWNDLLWPSIIMTDVENRTLTAGLSLLSGQYDRERASLMASTVLSIIPVMIIYVFVQKYLLKGMSLTDGNKE